MQTLTQTRKESLSILKMAKMKKSHWFSPMDGSLIGVVFKKDEHGNESSYIGTGFGLDQESDEKRILETGAKFPVDMSKQLLSISDD